MRIRQVLQTTWLYLLLGLFYRDGLRWHELYQGNELALQVDMSVPLKKVIADMCREDEFDTGYFIVCNSQEVYDSLCKRVREFCLAQAPSAIPIGSTNL